MLLVQLPASENIDLAGFAALRLDGYLFGQDCADFLQAVRVLHGLVDNVVPVVGNTADLRRRVFLDVKEIDGVHHLRVLAAGILQALDVHAVAVGIGVSVRVVGLYKQHNRVTGLLHRIVRRASLHDLAGVQVGDGDGHVGVFLCM